jgi:UDP-4-amino-4,6-dideoxy-N-acetyl-beta-L-altrosamine N-acetyltransferase
VLRAAVDGDRDTALTWRNHPDVRRVSLTTHVIGASEHRAWWAAATADPARRVLIFEQDGRPAGVVMFAGLTGDVATWGFYLDVAGLNARGALLSTWLRLEREAVDHAFDTLKVERLGGETLARNIQVLALHRRFGFEETDRYTRLVDGEPQEVVRTERGRT